MVVLERQLHYSSQAHGHAWDHLEIGRGKTLLGFGGKTKNAKIPAITQYNTTQWGTVSNKVMIVSLLGNPQTRILIEMYSQARTHSSGAWKKCISSIPSGNAFSFLYINPWTLAIDLSQFIHSLIQRLYVEQVQCSRYSAKCWVINNADCFSHTELRVQLDR